MANKPVSRLEELTRFIEFLSERFKETEIRFADRLDVTERELALLRTLVNEGPMIIRALGSRFRVPVSTMTGLIDRMESRGLVRRIRHRRDRRSIELETTPSGTLALREHSRLLEAISRGLLDALPEREQKSLIAILRRVRSAVELEQAKRSA